MMSTIDTASLAGRIFAALCNTSFLVTVGTLIFSSAIYTAYQLFFHPLSQYPGPLLGRVTQWYDVYHSYIGDKHLLFYELHQRYGSVVRISPNTLSINDPDALKAVHAHGANVQKAVFYKCFRAAPTAISTLLATDKHQHARKRRVMGQAFSDQALRGFEQSVLGHVQDLVDRVGAIVDRGGDEKNRWSPSLDMSTWCNWLVFDIMGDLVFGRSFGTLGERPENRRGIYLLGRAARRNYVVAAMPLLISTGLERVLPILRSLYRDRADYLAFGKKQVQERTNHQAESPLIESGRRDIFSFLMHATDPESGQGLSTNELWMEGNTLIVAGSDTTSTTLCAVLFYLMRHPQALARLEVEVRSAFIDASEIRMGRQMQSCKFLRACIDETMRMTPAVGGMLPREVLPGGLAIPSLGLHLPAGVDVGVPIYALQHHSEYIVRPFCFEPERWLPAADGDERHPQCLDALHAVATPFGIGNRACLGKPLVYMELSIAVARLLWEFDLRQAQDQHVSGFIARGIRAGRRPPGDYQLQDWFMSRNEGPWVEFQRCARAESA